MADQSNLRSLLDALLAGYDPSREWGGIDPMDPLAPYRVGAGIVGTAGRYAGEGLAALNTLRQTFEKAYRGEGYDPVQDVTVPLLDLGMTTTVAGRAPAGSLGSMVGKKGAKRSPIEVWSDGVKAVDVYHGTTHDIVGDVLQPGKYGVANQIGPHLAADPRVANTFSSGEYAFTSDWPASKYSSMREAQLVGVDRHGQERVMKPGGRTVHGDLAARKIYDVPQVDINGKMLWDDSAVERDALKYVFDKKDNKDLFVEWAQKRRLLGKKDAEDLYSRLKNGKEYRQIWRGDIKQWVPDTSYPPHTFESYIANYSGMTGNPELGKEVARIYREGLRDEGYEAIRYQNTSGNEVVSGADPTAYILLDPTRFKSKFNRGTYNPNDPNFLRGQVGAPVPVNSNEGKMREELMRRIMSGKIL